MLSQNDFKLTGIDLQYDYKSSLNLLTDQTRIRIDSSKIDIMTDHGMWCKTRNSICNCPGNALSDVFERVFVFHISCEDMMDKDKSIALRQKRIRDDTLVPDQWDDKDKSLIVLRQKRNFENFVLISPSFMGAKVCNFDFFF